MKLLVHERTKQGRRRINLVRGRVHLQGPADTGIQPSSAANDRRQDVPPFAATAKTTRSELTVGIRA